MRARSLPTAVSWRKMPRTWRALITGRLELEDERLLLRYRIESLSLERTTALSGLEAATMAYALHRAGMGELTDEDRTRVEAALATLGPELVLDVGPG